MESSYTEDLDDFSCSPGFSAALPVGGMGIDYIYFEDYQKNQYMGLSFSVLAGAELEGHVNFNSTGTLEGEV